MFTAPSGNKKKKKKERTTETGRDKEWERELVTDRDNYFM